MTRRARRLGPPYLKSYLSCAESARAQGGFTLIEMLITVSVVAVVVLGLSSMFADLALLQRRGTQGSSFSTMNQLLVSTIKNPQAWTRTIADATNAEMACLRTNTPCVSLIAGVRQWYDLQLRDGGNSIVFNGRNAAQGFTVNGNLCATFSQIAPDALCPMRFDLQWSATCVVGSDTCVAPNIEVRGTPLYAAASAQTEFNVAKHSFLVQRRGSGRQNEKISIAHIQNEGVAPGTGELGHALTCVNRWEPRQLNTEIEDPGANATVAGGNQFTLVAGTYSCRISAPATKAGGVRIRLRGVAGGAFTTVNSPPVVATQYDGSVRAQVDTVFTLTAPTTFQVEQYCTQAPVPPGFGASGTAAANMVFGRPEQPFNRVVYTEINCERVRCFDVGCGDGTQ